MSPKARDPAPDSGVGCVAICLAQLAVIVVGDNTPEPFHTVHPSELLGVLILTDQVPISEFELMLWGLLDKVKEHLDLSLAPQALLEIGFKATENVVPVAETLERVIPMHLHGEEILHTQQRPAFLIPVVKGEDAGIKLAAFH